MSENGQLGPVPVLPTRGGWKKTLLILALLAFACFEIWLWIKPPSNAEMILNFERNRAVFEQLVTMVQDDQVLNRIDDTWTDPADPSSVGISAGRIATYRILMNGIGVPRGFYG